MRTAHIARHRRRALALLASAALLGLSACGPGTGDDTAESTPAPSTSSETAETPQDEPSDDAESADDGSATPSEDAPDDGGADDDAGGTTAPGQRVRIMLRIDTGVDETGGEGAPILAAADLAALLNDPFDGEAECAGDLVLEPDADPVACTGPTSFDDTAPNQDWVANVAMVPSETGFESGSQVAVLFSTGTRFPEEAEKLLDEDVVLTGVGFGSVFGMNPLSAEQVAESALSTLTSEFAYVRVDQDAEWTSVTCEDGLDFTVFETVDCEASTADGSTWDLEVAPGTYADNDQGLLVGIEVTRG